MRVGLIGGVESSLVLLKSLRKHNFEIVKVYAYAPKSHNLVSGYVDLSEYCEEENIDHQKFRKINDHVADIVSDRLDVLFVVGLSQLVSDEIIDAPALGCVGFHPTALPRGRGRAPVGWLAETKEDGAASFFKISQEADAGPLFVQNSFYVSDSDNTKTIYKKVLNAMEIALDQWLPQLKAGVWNPVAQDETAATEYAIRKPEDGLISWEWSANKIMRLVQAATYPHPGAFTFLKLDKLIILDARWETEIPITGIAGRILKTKNGELLIQTGNGLIWITEYEGNTRPLKVGDRLGYITELEIFNIKREIVALKKFMEKKDD